MNKRRCRCTLKEAQAYLRFSFSSIVSVKFASDALVIFIASSLTADKVVIYCLYLDQSSRNGHLFSHCLFFLFVISLTCYYQFKVLRYSILSVNVCISGLKCKLC